MRPLCAPSPGRRPPGRPPAARGLPDRRTRGGLRPPPVTDAYLKGVGQCGRGGYPNRYIVHSKLSGRGGWGESCSYARHVRLFLSSTTTTRPPAQKTGRAPWGHPRLRWTTAGDGMGSATRDEVRGGNCYVWISSKSGRKKTPGPGALSEFGTLAGRNSARGAAVTPKRKVPTGVGEGWEVGWLMGPPERDLW